MAIERELKFDLDPSSLRRQPPTPNQATPNQASPTLACPTQASPDPAPDRPLVAGTGPLGPQSIDLDDLDLVFSAPRTLTLVADYWDTPSGRLRSWGVTMRHRSASDDSESGWTVKIPVPAPLPKLELARRGRPLDQPTALHARREVDEPGSEASPPGRVLAVVSGLIGGEALGRVARLTTVRTSTDVVAHGRTPGVDPGVRADEDLVIAESRDEVRRFAQLEIESTGDDELLEVIARRADSIGLARSGSANKLEQTLGPSTDAVALSAPLAPSSDLRSAVQTAVTIPLRSMLAADALLRDDLTSIPPLGSDERRWVPDPTAWRITQFATRQLRDNLVSLGLWGREPGEDPMLDSATQFVELLDDLDDAHTVILRLRPLGSTNPFTASVEVELERAGRAVSTALHSPSHRELLAALEHAAAHPEPLAAFDGSVPAASLLLEANLGAWSRLAHVVQAAESAPAGSTAADAAMSVVLDASAGARAIAELSAPVLGNGAAQAAERLALLESVLTTRRDAVVFQHWIQHFVVEHGALLDSATAFRAGELHMAARLDPSRTVDWHRIWERAQKRRPERW